MDENEEEFYDSLEEDQNFYDVSSEYHSDVYCESSITHLETEKPILTIPLYVGETVKDDLKINQKILQPKSSNKASKTCLFAEKKKTGTSYWTIYCQKNGIPIVDNNEDSPLNTNATKNFTSFIKYNCFLNDSKWDAPSFFEKYIPSKYSKKYDGEEQKSNISKSIVVTTTAPPTLQEIKSVSQNDLMMSSESRVSRVSKSKSSTSNLSLRPLTLKMNSPCETKLENLRKKWEYGHKASSRNRARIAQNINKIKHAVGE